MKLRIADRILVACAGLLLLAGFAGLVAQIFFQADLVSFAERVFASESPTAHWALIGMAALLLVLGLYCVMVLFRHRKRKDRFVLQKNENGELMISLKALETMTRKCVDQHEELQMQNLCLETRKDGILIQIRGSVAGGVSIPLTVESLQKQIRQYVTACSGVDIKGIRVEIDESGQEVENAPFAIAAPSVRQMLKDSEEKAALHKAPVEAYVTGPAAPVPQETIAAPEQTSAPEPEPAPIDAYEEEEDDRPLHQRIFSQEPEPCLYPEPPETEAFPPEKTDNAAEPENAPVSADGAEILNKTEQEGPEGTSEEETEAPWPETAFGTEEMPEQISAASGEPAEADVPEAFQPEMPGEPEAIDEAGMNGKTEKADTTEKTDEPQVSITDEKERQE